MIIKYDPADGAPQRWDLKDVRILSSEAEAIERVSDMEWSEVQAKVRKVNIRALRAMAWVLLKRATPTLRYRDFDPAVDELSIRYDAEERAALREGFDASDELTDEELEQLHRELDDMAEEERQEAPAPPEPAPAPVVENHPDTVPKASAAAASPTSG